MTGDLAHKMIFPALYAMVRRGVLKVPVVGVASSHWDLAQLQERAKDSIERSGGADDPNALRRLLSLLRYVDGDYGDPGTFALLKQAFEEDSVAAAWAVVDPVLRNHHRACLYEPGSWGPEEADALITADGGWHNPGQGERE
jgi:glucose-6-phosphate 1-dehydrogenase